MKEVALLPEGLTERPVAPTRPRHRRVRRALGWLGLLFGLYLTTGALLAWETVRPKCGTLDVTPALYRLAFQSVAFHSNDGTPLAGWLVPAANKPMGVIVLCHGVDSTRIAMLAKANLLHRAGFATFLFDFRARGESGGAHSTMGYREVDDLLAAIHAVQARPDMAGIPLGVYGESMGGAVVLLATARCPTIEAVVAESPFASLDHALYNQFRNALGPICGPILALPTRWFGERIVGVACRDIAPIRVIGSIAPRPVLLIQDGADLLCPPEETRLLFAAAGQPKMLWTVPNADHIGAFPTAPQAFAERVPAFFASAFATSPNALGTGSLFPISQERG